MSKYHLVQRNIATLLAPIDSPQLSDFVANLDRINALAEESPGFVWRLQTEEGDATGIDYFGCDKIVNLSVWDSVEALHNYVYRSAHVEIMRRKKGVVSVNGTGIYGALVGACRSHSVNRRGGAKAEHSAREWPNRGGFHVQESVPGSQ